MTAQAAAPAPSPAAVAAPGAAFAPNPELLRKALAIQDPTLKSEVVAALLSGQGAPAPAEGVSTPQVAPEQAPAGLPEASTAIPAAPVEAPVPAEAGIPGPIPEGVSSAVAALRGPKIRIPGVQPSFEDPIENHFINAYIDILQASHKLATSGAADHKQIDPGAFENLRVLQDSKARPAAKAEAQARFLNAYSVRGKFLVAYVLGGTAPGKSPSEAEIGIFRRAQKTLVEGLQNSGVSSRAAKLAVDEASGTGLMFGRNLEDWHTSSSTTAVDRAIDGANAIMNHIEKNPQVLAEVSDYVPLIQRTVASIVHNGQTLQDQSLLDYNAFYEKGKFQSFNYSDAMHMLKVKAGMWGGLDWGKVRLVLDNIQLIADENGFVTATTNNDVAANLIPEVKSAQGEEAVSAELKRFIRRVHKTVVAYEYSDRGGRRTGIRDFWFDANGFITPEQRWLDSYGFGPDFALDRAATINYYPGIENAPAELEPLLRDGFRDLVERHPTLFPVYRGNDVRIGEPGTPEYGIGDFATIESSGSEGITNGALELTRQAIRDLSQSGITMKMMHNTTDDVVEYEVEGVGGKKTTVAIKPGKFHFALSSEIMAEEASLKDLGIEVIDVPAGYLTYRPVVNSELAVVNSHTQTGVFRVARASGLGEMRDILESPQEMNGFVTLERNPGFMPDPLETLRKLEIVRGAKGPRLGQTMETTTDKVSVPETDGMVNITVMVGHQLKQVPSGAEAAVTEIKTGATVTPSIKVDGKVIPLVPSISVPVPDITAPIYKTFRAPIELFNPNLDPNHPLLQDPQNQFLKDSIERGSYTGVPVDATTESDLKTIEIKSTPRFDLQGAFKVQMAGKFPGAPVLEGTGTSGDQTVSESVAQQYDSNAEFRAFRKAQLLGKTEGGLPVDETTNILAQPEAFETPGGKTTGVLDRNVRILLGYEMPTSIAEIDSVIAASGMGPESSAIVRARLVKNYEYVNSEGVAGIAEGVINKAARRASSGMRVMPLDALYDGNMGQIGVDPQLEAQLSGASSEQIAARLLQHLLRIEMFSSRKLHYYSVVTERAPQNQNIEGVRQMTQNVINFIADHPEVRTALYKAEVARASDVIFASMSDKPGKATGEIVSPGKETKSVFTIDTNPAIIAYGSRRAGTAEDVSIAWQLATDFEKKLTGGFDMSTVSIDTPRQYVNSEGKVVTEQLPGQADTQTGIGKMDVNWLTPPAKRGDTVISLLRATKFPMWHIEGIIQDGSFVEKNGQLLEGLGIATQDADGNYILSQKAKLDAFVQPGTRLNIPVDQDLLDRRQDLLDKQNVVQGKATEVVPEAAVTSPAAPTPARPSTVEPTTQETVTKIMASINSLQDQLAAATDPELKVKLSLDIANRQRMMAETVERITKSKFREGAATEIAEPGAAAKTPAVVVADYKLAFANMAVRNPERAKRVLDLAHAIAINNLATQRTGVFGQIVRQLEGSYANRSKAATVKQLGYIELPETVQAEANADFVANISRYPEVMMDSESAGTVYVINDFGATNKVFGGSVPDEFAEDGEIPMWKHVSKYIARNQTSLVYTIDADGVGKFGIMPVVTEPSANGELTYTAAPEAMRGNGLSLEEMNQQLTSMGLGQYVDTVTEIPMPPEIPAGATEEAKAAAMEAYTAELNSFIEQNGMTMFDVQLAQGNYSLAMNRDYFLQDSRLHEVPEASLFDGAVSGMFYHEVASLVEQDPRVKLKDIFPATIIDENGRILEPTLAYAALSNDARNRSGVIKIRTTAGMSVGEKVTRQKVVIGEGHLDLAYLRRANAELAAEARAGQLGGGNPSATRAQQILDAAIMKAEAEGFKYQDYNEPKAFNGKGPETGPTNTAAKFNRYGKGVIRGTAGAVALMALAHEMRYGSSDDNEMASLEGVYNKAASYAPLAGTVAAVEGVSRLPIPTKFGGTAAAGGIASAAMLGYTAMTGGDVLRTAIGLVGGTVAGIAGGLASGGTLALPASIAGGVAADELYAKLTGKDSTFDFTPIRSVPKNVAKVETTGNTRADLESQYSSKGGFRG